MYKTDNSNLPCDILEQETDTVLLSSIQTTYGEVVSHVKILNLRTLLDLIKLHKKFKIMYIGHS